MSIEPVMDHDIVLIAWADAHCGPSGWTELDAYEDDGEAMVYTVGYLIPEGTRGSKAGHLTLWQTLSEGEGIHPFHIPLAMVRSKTVLNHAMRSPERREPF